MSVLVPRLPNMHEDADFDAEFDLRADTPEGKDPDTYSKSLRRYHRMLWSKELPVGGVFTVEPQGSDRYLVHDSKLGRYVLGSDTIATSHPGKRADLYAQLPRRENDEFHRVGQTIGGHIVFPGVPTGGRQTVNQARGFHPLVEDRFDLTLECIRRHYAGEPSPLAETLAAYGLFFGLFRDFAGYVEFFHLGDLVDGSGEIRYLHTFREFGPSPLPDALDDYRAYRERTLDFVRARNQRIMRWVIAKGLERGW